MKTRLLTALAVSAALSLSACHHDNDSDDSMASSANESLSSPGATADTTPPPTDMASGPAESMPSGAAPAPDANAASAAPPAPASDNAMSFDDMDRNHDGHVAASELDDSDPLKAHFSEVDSNSDGKMSKKELTAYRKKLAASAAPAAPGS